MYFQIFIILEIMSNLQCLRINLVIVESIPQKNFTLKKKKKKLTQMHCFALLELDRQLCAGRFENWQQVYAQSLLNLWEFKTCHLSQSAQIATAMRIFCVFRVQVLN